MLTITENVSELEDARRPQEHSCAKHCTFEFLLKWKCGEEKFIEGKFNAQARQDIRRKDDFVRMLVMYLGVCIEHISDAISFEKNPFSPPLFSLASLSSRTVFNSTSTS